MLILFEYAWPQKRKPVRTNSSASVPTVSVGRLTSLPKNITEKISKDFPSINKKIKNSLSIKYICKVHMSQVKMKSGYHLSNKYRVSSQVEALPGDPSIHMKGCPIKLSWIEKKI